ncbi:hypothetical protein BGZ76_008124, partial [Entomortierella beljakovae]
MPPGSALQSDYAIKKEVRASSTHSATKRAPPPPTRGVLPPSSRIRGGPRIMPPGSASRSDYATKK